MKKIKVLIVAGSMDVGGVENQLMHLIRNADKEKFQIDFTSTMENAFYREEIESLGGRFIMIPPMSWKKPQEYCQTLYNIMKDGCYDIVHSHELFHSGIVLTIAAKAGIKGRICHSHSLSDGDGISSKRSFIRTVYNVVMRFLINRYATMRIACASTAGEFLYGKKKCQGTDYRIVYNSIDTTKYLDNYDEKVFGEFCDEWINVLHVGRVYPVKRQLFDVEIAKEFKSAGKKIRVLCAGNAFDQEYMNEINTAIKNNQLSDYIKMLGSRKDVDVLFRKSSVAILPSVYEGMPLVMIEAQSAGVPCVVSDTFSHEVDFDNGRISWLPYDADAHEWAIQIEQAIHLGKDSEKQVRKAIERKNFDSKQFAKVLCDIYQNYV